MYNWLNVLQACRNMKDSVYKHVHIIIIIIIISIPHSTCNCHFSETAKPNFVKLCSYWEHIV